MNPGETTRPRASITRASLGILTRPRRPTATIESPSITTTESLSGARPEPSRSVAPRSTIAASFSIIVRTQPRKGTKKHKHLRSTVCVFILILRLVGADVVSQFLAFGIVRLLLQKLFVFDRCFVF